MVLRNGKASSGAAVAAAVALLFASTSAAPAEAVLQPSGYLGELEPELIWELLIGGVVLASVTSAVALWATSVIRRLRRAEHRKNMLVDSVLSKLQQGVVISDASGRWCSATIAIWRCTA